MKLETPSKTGNLRRSWTAEGPYFFGSDIVVKLMNNAEYASFVEEGHRQTPGRYVPAIGKRLKASWVPGRWFMKNSVATVEQKLPSMLEPELKILQDILE